MIGQQCYTLMGFILLKHLLLLLLLLLLVHHKLACIFHSQYLFPTSRSPSLLSHIFHGFIFRISHKTLNLPLLASHKHHTDLSYLQTLHLLPHSLPLCLSEVHLQPLALKCLLPFPQLFS